MKLAQIDFDPLSIVATPKFGPGAQIGTIISAILPYLFPLAGLLLFLYLVFAGFQFLTSGGDPKKVEQAKQRLTNGIIGFLIVFISYWLVQIIARILGLTKVTEIFG